MLGRIPKRRISKKVHAARQAFRKRVIEFLLSLGGAPQEGPDEYVLETPLGPLRVNVWDNAIMCRFHDVDRATQYTRDVCHRPCNPYSGKWNFHFFDDHASMLHGQPECEFVRLVSELMTIEQKSR